MQLMAQTPETNICASCAHLTWCVCWNLLICQRHLTPVLSRESKRRSARWRQSPQSLASCMYGAGRLRKRLGCHLEGRCSWLGTPLPGRWSCAHVQMRVQQQQGNRFPARWTLGEAGTFGRGFPFSFPCFLHDSLRNKSPHCRQSIGQKHAQHAVLRFCLPSHQAPIYLCYIAAVRGQQLVV